MRRSTTRVITTALLMCAAAPAAFAQHAGNGYLFHAPDAQVTLRGGYAFAAAGSDLFQFATDELTLNRRDFSSLTGGVELMFPIDGRFGLSVDASFMHSAAGSEFRHLIDNFNNPIRQTTTFDRAPIMFNARYSLAPLGRSIGSLAFIPTKVVPYVGAGAGVMYYRFNQSGDFVDFQTTNVFSAEYKTDGWAPAVQAFAGFDYSLTPSIALTTDARYMWAKGHVSNDYQGFNKIDLSGVSATVGLTFRL